MHYPNAIRSRVVSATSNYIILVEKSMGKMMEVTQKHADKEIGIIRFLFGFYWRWFVSLCTVSFMSLLVVLGLLSPDIIDTYAGEESAVKDKEMKGSE
jgi:hypothetical protein